MMSLLSSDFQEAQHIENVAADSSAKNATKGHMKSLTVVPIRELLDVPAQRHMQLRRPSPSPLQQYESSDRGATERVQHVLPYQLERASWSTV
jgi:hypothetical protein